MLERKDTLIPENFKSSIQTLKENCLWLTEKPSDLKQAFLRPNLGEGDSRDLKMDEIYVNVAIQEGRAHHYFEEDQDRREQLEQYQPSSQDCHFAKPEDLIDIDHNNVLVVGRPGIGKTSLSKRMLPIWVSGKVFNGDDHEKLAHFNLVFLVKFKRFNDNAVLSFRELLARAETVQHLNDSVWDIIKKESTKVLLIFDGVDDYSRKEDMNAQENDPNYKNDVEEKMPVTVLYNKLTAGKLLRGVSIVTTTRPTAVKYVDHVRFQRRVEIRGFTSENVEDYVEKFTRGVPGAKEKMWEHINSNLYLFSLCYIPVNCFLICDHLLQIIQSESSQALPKKITDIYKMIVTRVFFSHNRESWSPKDHEKLKSTLMSEPPQNVPKEIQRILNNLGKIAFKGIAEGRLRFESSEVIGLEDCGLLYKLPDEPTDREPKSQFCFTHLAVQEFFAAKHLVDTKTEKEIESFVRNHINDGKWQVVLQFVAGLLKPSLSSDIFINQFPKKTKKKRTDRLASERKKPKKQIYWPNKDKNLAVEVCKCLYESNDEQLLKLQNKMEKINFNTVELSKCSLAPIDLTAVLHFLENAEKVLHINLSSNELGDLGARDVSKFILNRDGKLKSLNLDNNKFTDKAAEDLSEVLKHRNCKLESLSLRGNNFTDNATQFLAAALTHSGCKLKYLNLTKNNLTDNAAKDFAAALKHDHCNLKSLDLSQNNFTDGASEDFVAALADTRHCTLELLDLMDNKFTKEGRRLIRKGNHCNCKVRFSIYD